MYKPDTPDQMTQETRVVNKVWELYDVYIGRPSKWGNPFTLKGKSVRERFYVIAQYAAYIEKGEGKHLLKDLHELKSKRLGCYCKPKTCHGDVLVELVEKYCHD